MGPHAERKGVRITGAQWTDNVARVYEVIRRHPEVSVEWPRVTGRSEYRASWPDDPSDEHSTISSVQALELRDLATALEEQFPDWGCRP